MPQLTGTLKNVLRIYNGYPTCYNKKVQKVSSYLF